MMKSQHLLLLFVVLLAPAAFADEVVFYRCTDAGGGLTMQNMPCPKGDKQEKKVMQSVSSTPMGATTTTPKPVGAAPPSTASTDAKPTEREPRMIMESGVTDETAPTDSASSSQRLPPPVLFQCTTYDKDSYITENEEPSSRCIVMRTVGLDGNPQQGAGEACEVVRDQCARVADGALCEAWKKRIGETEVAARFARPENAEKNQAEFERTQKIYRESTCAQ